MHRHPFGQYADHRRSAPVRGALVIHLRPSQPQRAGPHSYRFPANPHFTNCLTMNTRKLEFWILLADLAWTGVAFLGADLLRFGLTWDPNERASIHALLPFALTSCAIWVALSAFMQMDGFRGGWKLSAVFFHLLLGIACTFTVTLTLGYL